MRLAWSSRGYFNQERIGNERMKIEPFPTGVQEKRDEKKCYFLYLGTASISHKYNCRFDETESKTFGAREAGKECKEKRQTEVARIMRAFQAGGAIDREKSEKRKQRGFHS